ncbi:hypothetical protein LPTSP3_g24700 [Leptospira kobayashii]|uniref:DUF1343 domain-containing protein n=1 Tax=Leptospira kobayashii TaxID=1917830 RepID=A0ABM7UKX6_9LEPT|nr:DUF1343 domain-containing protein [Leptospira kobayashii]BDA79540.1 hypothetical protein LPTSP3_g24700 [Leptospira kobayashii]
MKFIKNLKKLSGCSAGILTNQSAFGWNKNYHFISFGEDIKIDTLFLPEHGLFAELQDQVSGSELGYMFGDCNIVNLYGDNEESLVPPRDVLQRLDIIVIDIRDVGSRYYTFLTTAYYILEGVSKLKKETGKAPLFIVVDSPNPIGDKVEGSPLAAEFESFVGVRSVPHRHGLSPAGLLNYYNETFDLKVEIAGIPIGVYHPKSYQTLLWVPPSPNIPTQNTCYVYPGQCLLEGTNLSEGRGTTKPFETFGAPYLKGKAKDELDKRLKAHQTTTVILRPLRFLPTFHKFKDQICEGYQLLIENPKKFHSLYFTLFFLKNLKELFPDEFQYLKGVYEFRSDKPAIELLAGDTKLLQYLDGGIPDSELVSYLENEEKNWFLATKRFRY